MRSAVAAPRRERSSTPRTPPTGPAPYGSGGPVGATETMSLKVFLEAFKYYRMGTASAGAVVIFAVNVFFAIVYARILRDESRT